MYIHTYYWTIWDILGARKTIHMSQIFEVLFMKNWAACRRENNQYEYIVKKNVYIQINFSRLRSSSLKQ